MWWLYLVAGCLVVYFAWVKKRKSYGAIPSPKGHFFFGNALQICSVNQIQKWREELGDVYSYRIPGKQFVIVSGEEAIRDVLITKTADFSGRPFTPYSHGLVRNNTSVAVSTDSERWREMKRSVLTGLRMYGNNLLTLESIALDSIKDLVAKFKCHQGKAFDPSEDCLHLICDIMIQLVRGKGAPPGFLGKFAEALSQLNGITGVGMSSMSYMLMPWLKHFGHPHAKVLNKVHNFRKEQFGAMIEERKLQFNIEEPKCLIDALCRDYLTKKNKHGEPLFNEDEMTLIVSDVMTAGLWTTQRVVYAFIAIMSLNPKIQTRLQKEADDVIENGEPRLVNKADMHYTRATLFEILRYISHLPLLLHHETTRTTTLKGFTIPKGTEIWTNVFGLHHDERYWDEPWTIKPERFLDQDGHLVGADHQNRRRLLAFGAGRRLCPGDVLAMNRLFLILASLMKNFNFVPVDGEEPEIDPRSHVPGVVLTTPSYKIHAQIRHQ